MLIMLFAEKIFPQEMHTVRFSQTKLMKNNVKNEFICEIYFFTVDLQVKGT